jgi:glycosyltransferase involved in cell wall biosynthesis
VEWARSGIEITVITCAPNFPQGKVYPGYRNRLIQKETVAGIKVIRVWTYMAPNKGFFRRTLDYLSFMVSAFIAGLWVKTDLIIATSPQFFTAVAGYMLSKAKRKPWVMEVRDLWPDSIIGVEAMKRNRMLDFFFRLEIKMYNHARLVIPVTDTFKERIAGKGVAVEKIHVIKNGSNLELFKPTAPDLKLKQEICKPDRIIMSYIGTHGMAHGLDFIVGCAGELDKMNITLLLIGDGAKKQEVVEMVAAGKHPNVVCLPPVPKEEIPRYLSISDIALIPLKKAEIFETVIPSKIFESAAMEIPILLGVDGEARRMVESYQAGLFYQPENKMDFLEKVKTLISKPELINRLKQGGAALSSDYDRKKQARLFLEKILSIKPQH